MVVKKSPYGWQEFEGKKTLRVSLADAKKHQLAVVYEEAMRCKFEEGKFLFVKDILTKDELVHITKKSAIFRLV